MDEQGTSLGLVWFLMVLASGCSHPVVEGRVIDPWGQPIKGAQVRVDKTTHTAVTGSDGRYELTFPPGEFVVKVSADGHTSHQIPLNVQQPVAVPAEDVKLFPLPTTKDVFALANGEAVAIPTVPIEQQLISQDLFSSTYKLLCPEEGSVVVPAGSVEFIDRTPGVLMLATLGGYGLFLTSDHKSNKKSGYNGLMKDSKEKVGAEELTVRRATLEAGRYAWIELKRNRSDKLDVDKKGFCRPFIVE